MLGVEGEWSLGGFQRLDTGLLVHFLEIKTQGVTMVLRLARLACLLAIICSAASCSNSIRPDAAEQKSGFVPGEVLVQFSESVSPEEALKIVEKYGLVWRQWISELLNIALIGTPVGQEKEWVETLNSDSRVVVAQLNHTGIKLR